MPGLVQDVQDEAGAFFGRAAVFVCAEVCLGLSLLVRSIWGGSGRGRYGMVPCCSGIDLERSQLTSHRVNKNELKRNIPIKYPCAPCNSTPPNPASAISLAVSTKHLTAFSISPFVISRGFVHATAAIILSSKLSPTLIGTALGAIVDANIPRRPATRNDCRPGWQICAMAGVPCFWQAEA